MDDPNTIAQRKAAFRALEFILTQHPGGSPWEIEILTDAILPAGPIVVDRQYVGINKKTLKLAFIEACVVFKTRDTAEERDVDLASRIIWLHDPEHLTASNYRKRRLEYHIHRTTLADIPWGFRAVPSEFPDVPYPSADSGSGLLSISKLVESELILLSSILNSPLHRQTKSPTLWYHRYWVVNRYFASVFVSSQAQNTMSKVKSLVIQELAIVRKAGHEHACNYYAWQYARNLLTLLDASTMTDEAGQAVSAYIRSHSCSLCMKTFEWCRQHPSDVSGWSFLLFTMMRAPKYAERVYVMRQILIWIRDMQWQKEAAYSFLRRMALTPDVLVDDCHRSWIVELVDRYFAQMHGSLTGWTELQPILKNLIDSLDDFYERHELPGQPLELF